MKRLSHYFYREKRAREKEMEELDPSLIIDAKAKTRVTRQATKTVKPKSYNTSDFDTASARVRLCHTY